MVSSISYVDWVGGRALEMSAVGLLPDALQDSTFPIFPLLSTEGRGVSALTPEPARGTCCTNTTSCPCCLVSSSMEVTKFSSSNPDSMRGEVFNIQNKQPRDNDILYVMVILKGSVPMAFGGSQDPAYGELVSIGGLNPDENKKLSAGIASILESKLSISKFRFYLKFHNSKDNWA